MINVGIFTYDFYPFIGGQGRYAYEFYEQNEKYKKINLYIFSPSTNNIKNHIQIFPETLKSKFKNIEFSFKLQFKIKDLIKKNKIDVAHFQGGPGGVLMLQKLNIPVVYTSHHTYWQQSHYIKEQSWKKIFFWLEKKGFELANAVICDCKSTYDILRNKYDLSEIKISTIPIAIDLNKFKTPKRIISNKKEILYVGRIDKRKGVDFLINSMKIINYKDKNIQLHVVGNGKDKIRLENLSKKNSLNIKFHGYLTDEKLDELYTKISIQVIPSVFEGFGLTVIEAMARKIPVVATNVDGIKDIIINNKEGILVQYGNEEKLADEIFELLKNYSLRKEIINNAFNKLSSFKWSILYNQVLLVYKGVLNGYSI